MLGQEGRDSGFPLPCPVPACWALIHDRECCFSLRAKQGKNIQTKPNAHGLPGVGVFWGHVLRFCHWHQPTRVPAHSIPSLSPFQLLVSSESPRLHLQSTLGSQQPLPSQRCPAEVWRAAGSGEHGFCHQKPSLPRLSQAAWLGQEGSAGPSSELRQCQSCRICVCAQTFPRGAAFAALTRLFFPLNSCSWLAASSQVGMQSWAGGTAPEAPQEPPAQPSTAACRVCAQQTPLQGSGLGETGTCSQPGKSVFTS